MMVAYWLFQNRALFRCRYYRVHTLIRTIFFITHCHNLSSSIDLTTHVCICCGLVTVIVIEDALTIWNDNSRKWNSHGDLDPQTTIHSQVSAWCDLTGVGVERETGGWTCTIGVCIICRPSSGCLPSSVRRFFSYCHCHCRQRIGSILDYIVCIRKPYAKYRRLN